MTTLIRLALVALFAVPMFAVTVGELQPGGGTVAARDDGLAGLTIISIARPALASGSVDRATVMWAGGPASGCTSAFKIKFFRAAAPNGLQVIAERGPFDAKAGVINVSLNPAVSLQAGDMIGITQLQTLSCGGVINRRADRNEAWASLSGDPTGTVTGEEYTFGLVASLRASSEASPVYGYLPVVGSTQGSFGSLFKTAVQLTNRGSSEITGRLVFRRANASPSSTDPSVVYTLAPNQTQSIDDVVVATGTTGLGSLDIVPTTGYPPDVAARIYNDAGASGTSGFTEEVLTPYKASYQASRASFAIPADATNFRMNVGVRTLDQGVTLNILEYEANGISTNIFVKRTFPANYFEQMTLAQFLDNNAVAPGGYIVVQVESGSAFIYASTTDNRTNDSAIRFADEY